MIEILICDDHTAIREGLPKIINEYADMKVAAVAENAKQTLTLLEQRHIDVVILDLMLSETEMNGLELLARIKKNYPKTFVVVYTMHKVDPYAHLSITAGAKSFLTKRDRTEELIRAIRTIAKGMDYITHEVGSLLARIVKNDPELAHENILSQLEFQVLVKTGNGKSLEEIVDETRSNYKRVSEALHTMMDKMEFKKKSEITPYCKNHDLNDLV